MNHLRTSTPDLPVLPDRVCSHAIRSCIIIVTLVVRGLPLIKKASNPSLIISSQVAISSQSTGEKTIQLRPASAPRRTNTWMDSPP